MMVSSAHSEPVLPSVAQLRLWAQELGFASVGVAGLDLSAAEPGLRAWLEAGFHGEMDYMARHADLRVRPAELVPGACSAVMVSLDYRPDDPRWLAQAHETLEDPDRAYVSRYALGRDYHKLVRTRLQRLADRMRAALGPFGHRVFCDSAPVMEVELASRAGLGWRGKNTLLIDARRGSLFFLGTIYTTLPAPEDSPTPDHCGRCTRCIEICPTQAIIAPGRLDARRCISYLTIEHAGPIDRELRPLLGNRIYGCDDCQLVCPWNRFAQPTREPDFAPREGLDAAALADLMDWSAEEFDRRLQGSAIRRIGHERWLRNVAVALGNSAGGARAVAALRARRDHASEVVREHVAWALEQLGAAS